MKRSELTFAEGFNSTRGMNDNAFMSFDWDKAASIIKKELINHPSLTAEAGLQGDWAYTGGEIFSAGKPVTDEYTYLRSNWAEPTLILNWDGQEQMEIECYVTGEEHRFNADSKWDETSIALLK